MSGQARSWPGLLTRLVGRDDLGVDDTAWAMHQVMSGEASDAQIAGLVVALRAKGETPQEIAGLAKAMLEHVRPVSVDVSAIDVVGTGGDRAHTVNISTMTAVVVAAAGVPVVKHGNRAASSRCGTADVLEELGVAISLGPDQVARCVSEVGIGFCFAPLFHPALRHAAGPRRELGIPTAFNFLGPLTNPAQPGSGLIGCADRRMAPVMAQVFADTGRRALVVRGDDGLDEITTTTTTSVWIAADGAVRTAVLDPCALDVPAATAEQLRGGDVTENANVVRRLLAGETGPVRDAVLLNAGAALAAYDGVGDLLSDVFSGMARAARAVDTGAAQDLLQRWVASSQALAG